MIEIMIEMQHDRDEQTGLHCRPGDSTVYNNYVARVSYRAQVYEL